MSEAESDPDEFIRETADRLSEYGGFEDIAEWLVEEVDDES